MSRLFQPNIITDDSAGGGQIVNGSTLFRGEHNESFFKTPVAGDRKHWTLSVWFKQAQGPEANQDIIHAFDGSSSNRGEVRIKSETIYFYQGGGGGNRGAIYTDAKIRDRNAWYHLVVVADYDNGTQSERAKIYINGVRQSVQTSVGFSNEDGQLSAAIPHQIGLLEYGSGYTGQSWQLSEFGGYMTQFYWIDGLVLDSSYFGFFDNMGIWRPKKYTGNFGTRGYYLPFDGSGPLHIDQSGNNNHWNIRKMNASAPIHMATGALPIRNTNAAGTQALAGFREDPLKSNLVVAWPGNTPDDVSHSVRGDNNIRSVTLHNSMDGDYSFETMFYGATQHFTKSTNDYVSITNHSTTLGTGDFTIECWFRFESRGQDMNLFELGKGTDNGGSDRVIFTQVRVNNTGTWDFHTRFYGTSNQYNSNMIKWEDDMIGRFYHFALVREGSSLRHYFNGQMIMEHNSFSENLTNAITHARIGYMLGDGTKSWDGNIQDFRFYNTAKYKDSVYGSKGSFIPAAGYHPSIVLDSPSGVAVPRKPRQLENGSIVFHTGNTEYLSIAPTADFDFGTGDFTIEAYVWADELGSDHRCIFSNQYLDFKVTTGRIRLYTDSGSYSLRYIPRRSWVHLMACRSSGTFYVGVNGKVGFEGSPAGATSMGSNTGAEIGRKIRSGTEGFDGYISNLRVIKGTALYTSDYTPPSLPLQNITNTKLLCCQSPTDPTAAAVTPGTITKNGNLQVSRFNPVDEGEMGAPNNYATFASEAIFDSNHTVRRGGLRIDGGNDMQVSQGFNSGKYYCELEIVDTTSLVHFGISDASYGHFANNRLINVAGNIFVRNDASGPYTENGGSISNTTTVFDRNATFGTHDIMTMTIDLDSSPAIFQVFKNGNLRNKFTFTYDSGRSPIFFCCRCNSSNATTGGKLQFNFGQSTFKFPPPDNTFLPVCATNLERNVTPKKHFDVLTYTGTGSTQSITGLEFKPDLVWIKKRSDSAFHQLFDTVRGATYGLFPNSSNGQYQDSGNLQSFIGGGFTADGFNGTNASSGTYVAWCWKAGGGNSGGYWKDGVEYASKTDILSGGIINQIGSASINTKAGLSIISFGGTGGSADLPHGLGKVPHWILIKKYSAGGNSWAVYHQGAGANKQLLLNSTNAASTDNNGFDAVPDANFVHLGSGASMATNQTGQNIAYIWTEIPGYSKFGIYRGNNNTNGPYVYCGFKPGFIMIKNLEAGSTEWYILDSARDTDNPQNLYLTSSAANAEASYTFWDVYSDGFKLKNTGAAQNPDTQDVAYMVFAEEGISTPYGVAPNAR